MRILTNGLFDMDEKTDIKYLKTVGEKRAKLLQKIDIFTVGDLLRYYPRDYLDWSEVCSIAEAPFDENCCIRAFVDHKPVGAKIRSGLTIYKTVVTDGESLMNVTIYNNKYAAESLCAGCEYLFYGKVGGTFRRREMNSPLIAPIEATDRIQPIYRQTAGINSRYIEKLVKQVYEAGGCTLTECIPLSVREKLCLPEINKAVHTMHFPENYDMLAEARRRMVFEELFVFRTGLMLMRGGRQKTTPIRIEKDFTQEFFASLPFTPTAAQRRAVRECTNQMLSQITMNRLLQGDVGSGKTAVAAAVIYTVIRNGFQCAFMAPTEILASQHYATCLKFFQNFNIKIALLTGSVTPAKKREIKKLLAEGEIQLIIGTHALISEDVAFQNLGLVITDEQHRFGVRHRGALGQKGCSPHTLVMSATPIPRTLALAVYGDLDVSVLDKLPPGRQPIETYAIGSDKRARAFNYVKKHLQSGRQGYIVCPLVEENDSELASAQEYAENIAKGFFSGFTVGLLHGKMKAKEKDAVMAAFVNGKIQLLVSTTVIEVGVDVPNAVIMVIENAERFGLSQLHQLRGRIGRGQYQSTCILITDAKGEAVSRRMKIMTQTNDGFQIADEDLQMRGPGDFFGSRQHGLPDMRLAQLTDTPTLAEANRFAEEILTADPELQQSENRPLKEAAEALFKTNVMN